jgi:hypothetical protein
VWHPLFKERSLLKQAPDIHCQRELVGLVQMPGKEVEPSGNLRSPLFALSIPIDLPDFGLRTDAADTTASRMAFILLLPSIGLRLEFFARQIWDAPGQVAVLASGVTCLSILCAFAFSAMRRSYSVCRFSQDCASPPK